MPSSLTLGSVTFSDFEIPEHFVIGGKQQLNIHALPGGGRIVDAMGAQDGSIRWSGVFSGQQAAERVRLLDRIRRGGQTQLLSWDAWRYDVVVEEFEAEIASSWWIPYRLQLCVLPDGTATSPDWLDSASSPSLTIAVLSAVSLEAQIAAAGTQIASSDLQTAFSGAGLLAQSVTARAYGGAQTT